MGEKENRVDQAVKGFADQHLARLEEELCEWRHQRAALDIRIETRRKLVEALKGEVAYKPQPTAVTDSAPSEPSGKWNGGAPVSPTTGEKVLTILREVGRPMRTSEVLASLEDRGWTPDVADPKAAVGSALWYLATKTRQVEQLGSRASRRWAAKVAHSPQEGQNPA